MLTASLQELLPLVANLADLLQLRVELMDGVVAPRHILLQAFELSLYSRIVSVPLGLTGLLALDGLARLVFDAVDVQTYLPEHRWPPGSGTWLKAELVQGLDAAVPRQPLLGQPQGVSRSTGQLFGIPQRDVDHVPNLVSIFRIDDPARLVFLDPSADLVVVAVDHRHPTGEVLCRAGHEGQIALQVLLEDIEGQAGATDLVHKSGVGDQAANRHLSSGQGAVAFQQRSRGERGVVGQHLLHLGCIHMDGEPVVGVVGQLFGQHLQSREGVHPGPGLTAEDDGTTGPALRGRFSNGPHQYRHGGDGHVVWPEACQDRPAREIQTLQLACAEQQVGLGQGLDLGGGVVLELTVAAVGVLDHKGSVQVDDQRPARIVYEVGKSPLLQHDDVWIHCPQDGVDALRREGELPEGLGGAGGQLIELHAGKGEHDAVPTTA